jgi:hypothetical protein
LASFSFALARLREPLTLRDSARVKDGVGYDPAKLNDSVRGMAGTR